MKTTVTYIIALFLCLNIFSGFAQEKTEQYVQVSGGLALSFPDKFLPGPYVSVGYARQSKLPWLSLTGDLSIALMQKEAEELRDFDRVLNAFDLNLAAMGMFSADKIRFGVFVGPTIRYLRFESISRIDHPVEGPLVFLPYKEKGLNFGVNTGVNIHFQLNEQFKVGLMYRSFLVDPLGNHSFALTLSRRF